MSGRERVSIIGLGAGGTAAARLALNEGETVYASDLATDPETRSRAGKLEAMGARVQLGAHDVARIEASEMVVVSPGIPPDAPVLRDLRARGVRWISEPEFAIRFYGGPLIVVTGTNGKTTTTALCAHLLSVSGFSVAWGGNVGAAMAPPASELALREPAPDWYVLELSSFQLADVETLAPEIGVVTNLAPDHLDRYPDTEAYFADKARLFERATPESRWVLNGDDAEVVSLAGDAPGVRCFFARTRVPGAASGASAAAYVDGGVLTMDPARAGPDAPDPEGTAGATDPEPLLAVDELRLLGDHNVMNALAAALAARAAGAGSEGVREGLRTFEPLPHRLEPVAEAAGVLWVNDSKATNVAAATGAIESLDRPLVVLLGGTDKGEDFGPLARVLPRRARAAVLYGEASGRLEDALASAGVSLVRVDGGFDAAVREAGSRARSGDAVLLSPACSSFDLFDGYEARGRRFTELARTGGTG